jgi:hypothetical protein
MRLDRKELLDKLEFSWKDDIADNNSDKQWHKHFQKLIKLRRKYGNCMVVPKEYEQDKVLVNWVTQQRYRHATNKLGQERKKLLDTLHFGWKDDRRSCTRDHVRYLVIESLHAWVRSHFSHSPSFFA